MLKAIILQAPGKEKIVLYCTNYVQTNESGRVDNAHLFEYYIGIIAMIQGSLGFRRVKMLDSPTCWGRGAKNPNKSHPKWGKSHPKWGKFGTPDMSPLQTPRDPLR